eukprot:XP_001698393.1 predicted protein [Chlamydomonas reinhardtii]
MGQTYGLVGGLVMVIIALASIPSDVEARDFKLNVQKGQQTLWQKSPPPKHRTSSPPPKRRAVAPPPPSPEPPSAPLPDPANSREKNGVRLVLGDGPRGRLELSSTEGWLTDYVDGAVAWLPVCQMIGFDDSKAQIMCELLGYTYGRLYYDDEVAWRPPNDTASYTDLPIENLDCSPNYPDAPPPSSEGGDQTAGGHRRRLLAPLRADINIPKNAPYTCSFYSYATKRCDYSGPLVGVECGAPPDRNVDLKLYGVGVGTVADLESNLCDSEEQDGCRSYERAEVLIADPANPGSQIWAPICSVDNNDDLAILVGDTLCKQVVNYPDPGYVSYSGEVQLPLQIPEEPDAAAEGNLFRPSKYTQWVTFTGGEPDARYPALQQLEYTVASACESAQLFAVFCSYADD